MRPYPMPEVQLAPAYCEVNGVTVEMPEHKAIINPVTNNVFAIASNKYKLVKHEDVLANVEEMIEANGNFGNYTKQINLDKDGARMRCVYTFKDMGIPVGEAQVNDIVSPTIETYNSYDLSWKHTVMLGANRLKCTNGLVVSEEFMTYRKKHTPDLYLEDVRNALEGGLEQLQIQAVQWNNWRNEKMEQANAEKILQRMQLNNKEKEELVKTKEVGTDISLDAWLTFGETAKEVITKWIFFNIVTQYITHNIKKESRKVQLENAFRKNIYR